MFAVSFRIPVRVLGDHLVYVNGSAYSKTHIGSGSSVAVVKKPSPKGTTPYFAEVIDSRYTQKVSKDFNWRIQRINKA